MGGQGANRDDAVEQHCTGHVLISNYSIFSWRFDDGNREEIGGSMRKISSKGSNEKLELKKTAKKTSYLFDFAHFWGNLGKSGKSKIWDLWGNLRKFEEKEETRENRRKTEEKGRETRRKTGGRKTGGKQNTRRQTENRIVKIEEIIFNSSNPVRKLISLAFSFFC